MLNLNKLFPRLTIRVKLAIAFVLLTVVPLVIVASIATAAWIRHLRVQARTDLAYDIEIAQLRATSSLREVEQRLQFLVDGFLREIVTERSGREIEQATEVLDALLRNDPSALFRIKAIDASGHPLLEASRDWLSREDSEGGSEEMLYTLIGEESTGENCVVLPVELRGNDERGAFRLIPAVAILQPIRVGSEYRGAVVAEASALDLFAGLDLASPGLEGTTGLVTSEGLFLYHSDRKDDWASLLAWQSDVDLETDYSTDTVATILSGESGTVTTENGELVAFRPISFGTFDQEPLILYRSLPLRSLDTSVRGFLATTSLAGLGIMAIVFLGALVAAKQFTRPIYEIRQASRLMAGGDHPAPLKIDTNDEFEDLAEDFNTMTETLVHHRDHLETLVEERTHDLEAARAELGQVLAHAADAIVGLDRDEVVRLWNRGAAELFGYAEDEAIGNRIDDLIGGTGEEFKAESVFIADTIASRRAITDLRTSRTSKDGSRIRVSLTQAPISDDSGLVLGSSLVIRDDRVQTQLEDQMRRSERLAAMSVMAAGLAHEINNPLAILENRIELMIRQTGQDPSDVRHEKGLSILKDHVDRLKGITSDLVGFARDEGDDRRPVSLTAAVKRMTSLLQQSFMAKQIALDLETEKVPEILGNEKAIETILMNLLMNAIDATSPNGTVGVHLRNSSVPGFVEVEVVDTGVGIPNAHRSRIFEPFFTTKDGKGGTGLGLTVCRAIVERHGGRIWVEDGDGCGSRFIVSLPLGREES